MPKYVWIIPEYAWLFLNVAKSIWMAFVLHLASVIPYLKELLAVFLKRFQICFYLLGAKGAEGAGSLESLYMQPMTYPRNISMMLFYLF